MTKKIKVSELPVFDAAEYLNSDEDIAAFLTSVLEENDTALLAAALGDIARFHIACLRGMTLVVKDSGRFNGFTVNVYHDDEGDYLAYFVELPSVSAFASTPEEALNELAVAWAGVQESYEKRGETVPVVPAHCIFR